MDWAEIIPLLIAICATGIIAGILAGLLGVGGGIVIVPVLFTLFGFTGVDESVRMHLAVGTSLSTIILTSISSMRAHMKKGALDLSLLRSWGAWIALGAIGGTVLAGQVSGTALSAVFAVIAFAMAFYMFFTPPDFKVTDDTPQGLFKATSGFSISGASAMMGIGGGTMFVPFLNAFGVPVHKSVGSAAGIGLIIALPATLGFVASGYGNPDLPLASVGYVNLLGMALIVPFTMVAAPFGARLAHWLSPQALKRAFGVFLFITAARMAASLF